MVNVMREGYQRRVGESSSTMVSVGPSPVGVRRTFIGVPSVLVRTDSLGACRLAASTCDALSLVSASSVFGHWLEQTRDGVGVDGYQNTIEVRQRRTES